MFDNPFSMVVAIVAIVMFASVMRARYGYHRNRNGHPGLPQADNREAMALREEVKTLKERVAVLERLATDHNDTARLEQEIARLRDK